MPCCSCKRAGTCQRCACFTSGVPCTDCYPSWDSRCKNGGNLGSTSSSSNNSSTRNSHRFIDNDEKRDGVQDGSRSLSRSHSQPAVSDRRRSHCVGHDQHEVVSLSQPSTRKAGNSGTQSRSIQKVCTRANSTGTSVANSGTPVFDTEELAPVNRDLGGRNEVLRNSTSAEVIPREDNLQSHHESSKEVLHRRVVSLTGPPDSEIRRMKRRCPVTIIVGSGARPCQISSVLLRQRSCGEGMYTGKRSCWR